VHLNGAGATRFSLTIIFGFKWYLNLSLVGATGP